MRGLLLKDLYALKGLGKQYGVLFLLMVGWSAFVKNVSFIIVYTIVLSGMLVLSTLSLDEAVHFDRWTLTTPAGARGMVMEKYVLLLLTVAAGTVTAFLINVIFACLFENMGTFEGEGLLISSAVFMLGYSIMLPMDFKLGVEKARYIYIGTIFGITAVLVGIFKLFEKCGIELEEAAGSSPALTIAVLGICILALVISYDVSLKMVKNREW